MHAVTESVPFLDLTREYREVEAEWMEAIHATGLEGHFILGPHVQAFEEEMAAYTGVDHAISVANGTDAITLSLRALGIGPGDEVITTPFTFFATAEAINHVGATPVFTDISEDSYTLDVDSVRERISNRTRAVIPVHLFGHPADMSGLMEIAEDRNIAVIEDCAQAFGANWGSRRVGSIGANGCFSFYPTKVLGCYGDGGLITTRSAELAGHLLRLRNHGAVSPFVHVEIGHNSRLDEIQAALLRIKLKRVDRNILRRRELADQYNELLHDSDVVTPALPRQGGHVFNLYTIRVRDRGRLRDCLTENRIASAVCYPKPLHLQEVYRELGYRAGDLPVCERLSGEVLSLPIYPEMTDSQVEHVCEVIRAALS